MKCVNTTLDENDKENLSAVALVQRMNKLAYYCSKHPEIQTDLLVSSASKEGTVRVVSICCQGFQNQLQKDLGLTFPSHQNYIHPPE